MSTPRHGKHARLAPLCSSAATPERGSAACVLPAGDAALDYFRATFPLLRGPGRMEGVADFVVDVTTQAAKQQAAGLEGGPRFAEAYQESGLREESERQLQACNRVCVGGGGLLALLIRFPVGGHVWVTMHAVHLLGQGPHMQHTLWGDALFEVQRLVGRQGGGSKTGVAVSF